MWSLPMIIFRARARDLKREEYDYYFRVESPVFYVNEWEQSDNHFRCQAFSSEWWNYQEGCFQSVIDRLVVFHNYKLFQVTICHCFSMPKQSQSFRIVVKIQK